MENPVESHYGDVLEGLKEEYRSLLDKPHLWSMMPRSVYLALVYEGIALEEQMERTLTELDSATNARMPAKPPESVGGERKAKAGWRTSSGQEIARLEAISARKAS